jgi:hypothetical protein
MKSCDIGTRIFIGYGAYWLIPKAVTAHTKFGLVIKIKGALFIKPRRVTFGTSVAPGLLDLSTYKGASPISFPLTNPKRFDIF